MRQITIKYTSADPHSEVKDFVCFSALISDNIRTIRDEQRYEYPDHYSDTYRLIIRLARLRENYSVDDCMLRMVLPNVIGRLAKRSKYKDEPERLFFDLFSKVDKLDTQSIIQETLKQTEIINKRRQQKKEIV